MNNNFDDIIEKLGPPKWWDDLGYPRYCDFHPDKHSNIYASEIAYILIQCQYCHEKFKIAEAITDSNILNIAAFDNPHLPGKTTAKDVDKHLFLPKIDKHNKVILDIGAFHYGDPPFHMHPHDGFSCTGNSMNIESLILLEMWEKEFPAGWRKMKLKEL